MMIKLSESLYVAASEIGEVRVSEYGNVIVRMKDGTKHTAPNDYGKPGYATMDRLVGEINAALQWERIE